MATEKTHFHSSDDRFCGSRAIARRFTLDPNYVTCLRCKARDCFVISEAGEAYLATVDKSLDERPQ